MILRPGEPARCHLDTGKCRGTRLTYVCAALDLDGAPGLYRVYMKGQERDDRTRSHPG
jgi:hypothetical protein